MIDRIDTRFDVPFTHRLRFTDDCFGMDWNELGSLMASDTDAPSRVQVWLDQGVADAIPGLRLAIQNRFQSARDLVLVSEVNLLPGGEEIKNDPQYVEQVLRSMDRDQIDRRNYIVAIGGGAFLDAIGFAATLAHRGIRLIRIPTTTLAQADSGIGVKNAVNAFGKKNWKGTFSVPWAVVNDSKLLQAQPDREFLSGFSEAVKVNLLKSASGFRELVRSAQRIAQREMRPALAAIKQSVILHMDHITKGGDPFESLEARPLDFGHWSAHKLEALTGFELRHGEAVAIGVALDTVYSSLVLGFSQEITHQVLTTLSELRLPIYHPMLNASKLFDGLEEFRQHLGGRLTLTMLRDLAVPYEVHEIDRKQMLVAIERLKIVYASNDSHSMSAPWVRSATPRPPLGVCDEGLRTS